MVSFRYSQIFIIFPEKYPLWNLADMDSQLKFLKLGEPKPKGIQTPMVYAGAPGSHFNPHVEENLLYSINYVFDVSTSLNSLFSNRFTIQDLISD